jgi:hypothetical protein
MTNVRTASHYRLVAACALSALFAMLCIWGYSLQANESAAAAAMEAQHLDCVQFAARIQKKPLHKYSASDIVRLNSCNATIARDQNAVF